MDWQGTTQLEAATSQHIIELRGFFKSADELSRWGGPNMGYPTTQKRFERDLQLDKLASRVLVMDGRLAGFGQFYRRLNHCHLGRLVIAPAFRGHRLIDLLIEQLLQQARAELGHTHASLFVLEDNLAAIKAYKRLGFRPKPYPEPMPMENCLYMTRFI